MGRESNWFGTSVALSADGNTLAVGATGESASGAVYVFTRSAFTWAQQAQVKGSNTSLFDHFGAAVALSADGNTLAVGASGESSAATGVGGNQIVTCSTPPLNCAFDSGAVYIYTRNVTTWIQTAYVKASNTAASDEFGYSVALSGDGNTLAVGAYYEDSAATGVNGDQMHACPATNCATDSGAVYIYTRSGITWSQAAYVKASNAGANDHFGSAVALSADGTTLAVGAIYEDGAKPGIISGAPGELVTGNGAIYSGAVYIFARSTASWTQQAYIKASKIRLGDYFGRSVALSADGNTLAVGADGEASAKLGIIPGAPDQFATGSGASSSGAVFVYARNITTWTQQAYVKASNTETRDNFGRAVTLSADGNTLAVGAYGEDSAATGVNNTVPGQSDNSAADAGAVYVY